MESVASTGSRLVLQGATAALLMTPRAPSIRENATIAEAVTLFADRGVGAAAVIDEAGRPVGVVSRTDLLIHEREQTRSGSGSAAPDASLVRDLMTPAVFAVPLEYPAENLVADLLRLKVHQLFVVDSAGVLVGIVSSQDILSHLQPVGVVDQGQAS